MVTRMLFLGLAFLISCQVNSATLRVDASGALLGAANINVGGTFYDVEFRDGTCITLFDGCDQLSDFPFLTDADVVEASDALLNEVFIDDISGAFDSQPDLTAGCNGTPQCYAFTPFGFGAASNSLLLGYALNNAVANGNDSARSNFSGGTGTDLTSRSSFTYAVWTPIKPVPVPAAIWLFGTALVGFIGFGRRGKAT